MKSRLAILCAALLSLTGCTGQAEPVAAASGAASSSAVAESSSEPAPSSTREPVGEPEVPSEPGSSDAAEPSSAVPSAQATSNAAEPASMPPSSSEPVDSSAAELSSEPEPPSSDLDKIPPGEPVEPLTPPPPLTPEQEEEERATRERLRLVDRAYALSKQVEKILPPDIFGGWAEVKQSLPVVLEVYVVDQAAASEILESYADPEIPFSYSIVKFSKSEMDAMIADLWEEEIIQKNKDKIYDISPDYWVADGYIEIDLFEPWPELNAWLEGYTSAAEITINDGTKEKTNPA